MRQALLLATHLGCAGGPQGPGEVADPADDIVYDAPIPLEAEYAADRIIVGFRPGEKIRELVLPAELGRRRLTQTRGWGRINAGLYELPAGVSVAEAVEAMRETGEYRWVEPDYVRYATAVNDTYRSYQWNFDAVNAESAWAYSTGSGVTVAVLDTGVTSGSSDGIGNLGTGYDYVNNDSDASDDNGHGTHVAGTIGAATDNSAGVAGLAYDATIMPVKVLDSSGAGYTSDVVSGISYAVSNGASVINMSLGSTSYSTSEASAVSSAYSSGLFVAAASGNSGASTVEYPAGYSGAVAVGATDYNDTRVSYSTYGSALDLMAPGGDVYADDNGDGYADGILQEAFEYGSWGFYFWEGTSMASPHVAAAAALLMANGATNAEAESYLGSTATDLSTSGWDSSTGWGLIQPDAALAAYAAATGDTGDTGTACATTLTTATWTASTGSLAVTATHSDSTDTLSAASDYNALGDLSYSSTSGAFEATITWPVAPDNITVTAGTCGTSDTLAVTVN